MRSVSPTGYFRSADVVDLDVAVRATPASTSAPRLVRYDLGSNPVLPLYKPTKYVECTGRDFDDVPLADPAQGC